MKVGANSVLRPPIQQNHDVLKIETRHVEIKETTEGMPSPNDLKEMVEQFNGFLEPVQTNLKFVYHEDLHEYYVTVINPLTDEVIREIPPRKMLDMYHAMTQYIGLLVDKKV